MNKRSFAVFRIYQEEPTHDTVVSFLWHILQTANPELADTLHTRTEKYKPFTWSYIRTIDGMNLTFSSTDATITQAFFDGCTILKKTSESALIDKTIFVVANVHSIGNIKTPFVMPEDSRSVNYYTLNLETCSPITLTRWSYGPKINISLQSEPVDWLKHLRNNLYRRTHTFNKDVIRIPPENIKICLVNRKESPDIIEYKGAKIPANHVTLRITAPAAYLETALYGGLGQRTGSGFGFATVV